VGCKQKFERRRTYSVPPLLNANMKIYEGKALLIRSAFTSECPSISKIRGVKGRGTAAKGNWRSLHTQSGRWKGCFSSDSNYAPLPSSVPKISVNVHSPAPMPPPPHISFVDERWRLLFERIFIRIFKPFDTSNLKASEMLCTFPLIQFQSPL